ncbi:hypothetical protein BDN71DRAFT_1457039 [Pleurotus eryngii]|uniref:SAP domain-containing protein n=1 Tax=Pleurotus eryngii TaxID=5323 RepID=A0A9P6D2I8_PLEER|nr:hypothetical protein BDN71DRAFT_1457039 [Pleurotus eryngii]
MPSVMDLAALLSILTLVTQLSDKNKINQLESEIKWKVKELDTKSLSLDASEGENDRLRTDAATEVISEESTSTRLAEAEASKAMVEESTRLSVERKFLKGRNDELVNTLSNMQQIRADLEQQCKDLMATVDSYAEDLSEYDQKIEDVRKAWDEAKTEATRLNKKLEQAETDIQLYISQVKSLEEALGGSRSQIHDYKSRLTASAKEVKTLTDENACLKDELQPVQGSHGSPWIDVNAEANVIEFDASDDGRLPDTPLKRPLRPWKLSQSAALLSKFEASASLPSDYDINEMTVAKLKEFLKSMNVKPKGLKLDLLEQALAAAREERKRLSHLNDGKSAS